MCCSHDARDISVIQWQNVSLTSPSVPLSCISIMEKSRVFEDMGIRSCLSLGRNLFRRKLHFLYSMCVLLSMHTWQSLLFLSLLLYQASYMQMFCTGRYCIPQVTVRVICKHLADPSWGLQSPVPKKSPSIQIPLLATIFRASAFPLTLKKRLPHFYFWLETASSEFIKLITEQPWCQNHWANIRWRVLHARWKSESKNVRVKRTWWSFVSAALC